MIDKTRVILGKIGFKKLFWCFFAIAVTLVAIVSIFPNNDAVPINNEKTESFNEGWALKNTGGEITLPYILKTVAKDTVEISKILPNEFEQSNPTLSFHSSLQTVTVKVDESVIYTYCENPDAYFDVQPPPAWHIIRLAPDMVGKTLSITYSSPFDNYAGVLNDIELGTKYANTSSFMGSHLFSIVLCLIIFTFGLFAMIICMFAHNKVADLNQLLYVGIASLLIAIWSVCETKTMQIFTGNVQAIMFITFLSIMLFPIPVLLFFRKNFGGKIRMLYNIMLGIFSLYFTIIVTLQIFSVANFNDYFVFLLILIGIMLLLIFSSLIVIYRQNKTLQNKMSIIAVSILLVFSSIDMYRYFFKNLALTSYSDTSMFARIGIMAMLFILGYSSIRQILVYYSENSKAEIYKMLAHTDSMSGLKNRAYLSEIYPLHFQNAAKQQTPFSLIMVDIDNFKNYNDHYGHNAGDEVIQSVATVLQTEAEIFGGMAIRYGGEEFLVVLPQGDRENSVLLAEKIKLGIAGKKMIHEYNSADIFVTVSQGIYSAVPTKEDSLEHFIDCSDQAMYTVKRSSKNGYGFYQDGC